MVHSWQIPGGMKGSTNLVRVGARMAGLDLLQSCPAQIAAKAHPEVSPRVRGPFKGQPLETFALGPLMDVLNRVEFEGESLQQALATVAQNRRPPSHPGLGTFTEHAVRGYLANLSNPLSRDEPMYPVRGFWVCRGKKDGVLRETWAWGRRYQSQDGAIRELRVFRFGTAGSRSRPSAELATAVYTTAFGSPAAWPDPWREPFDPVPPSGPAVRRVRIVEFGCLDSSSVVLFDGTVEEAAAMYAAGAQDVLRQRALGGAPNPGSDCADCKLITACDALPRVPGLLGIADSSKVRRTLSAATAKAYAKCPAQEHLSRTLHLPRPLDSEYGPKAVRGQAVHAVLEANHARMPRVPCQIDDFPDGSQDWSVGRWQVRDDQALVAARMLAHHVAVCPFRHADQIIDARVEPVIVAHDTAADVLIVAKPDLIYRDSEGWVWRETKTTQWYGPKTMTLLEEHPQLAFAVLLLRAGVLGPDSAGARIEVEVLRPDGADPSCLDPADPETAAEAQRIVTGLAGPWHADKRSMARPGESCRTCPVSQWCPDYAPPGTESDHILDADGVDEELLDDPQNDDAW